jgi:hypothetical protein
MGAITPPPPKASDKFRTLNESYKSRADLEYKDIKTLEMIKSGINEGLYDSIELKKLDKQMQKINDLESIALLDEKITDGEKEIITKAQNDLVLLAYSYQSGDNVEPVTAEFKQTASAKIDADIEDSEQLQYTHQAMGGVAQNAARVAYKLEAGGLTESEKRTVGEMGAHLGLVRSAAYWSERARAPDFKPTEELPQVIQDKFNKIDLDIMKDPEKLQTNLEMMFDAPAKRIYEIGSDLGISGLVEPSAWFDPGGAGL